MEMQEAVKIERIFGSSPLFPDHVQTSYPSQGLFEFCDGDKHSSLGFMELLGMQQDFAPSPAFDVLQVVQPKHPNLVVSKSEDSPEVLNQPTTPNSSSISSASSEALNEVEPVKAVDNEEDEQQQKTKKELKPKKSNQKRQREPRFAFMTKSEVDHLEDGYRWRKYGQKAVKNSPFPRSYYRCTYASCNVKKRVERSFNDPSIVVTTYEGQHTHPSPVMPRPSFASPSEPAAGLISNSVSMERRLSSLYQQQPHHQQQGGFVNGFLPNLGFGFNDGSGTTINNGNFLNDHHRRFCTNNTSSESGHLLEDHGLLQDVVLSHMLKEE